MTDGKSITSATPIARRRRRIAAMSSGPSGPCADSSALAGTQDGAITYTRSGRPLDASSIQCAPSAPSTLASSCGSHTTVVVPRGTTTRANSAGSSLDDSTCTCASISPGTTGRPAASIRSPPS